VRVIKLQSNAVPNVVTFHHHSRHFCELRRRLAVVIRNQSSS